MITQVESQIQAEMARPQMTAETPKKLEEGTGEGRVMAFCVPLVSEKSGRKLVRQIRPLGFPSRSTVWESSTRAVEVEVEGVCPRVLRPPQLPRLNRNRSHFRQLLELGAAPDRAADLLDSCASWQACPHGRVWLVRMFAPYLQEERPDYEAAIVRARELVAEHFEEVEAWP